MSFTTVRSHFEAFVHSPLVWFYYSGKIWDTLGNQEVKNSNAILLTLLKHKHGDLFSKNTLGQSVQLLSCVQLFATPWTAAHQASLSITNSWSLLKLMPIESVMPSNHLILCCPLLLPPSMFPRIKVFSNESVLHIRWPKYDASASASVLPGNIQDWFTLGLTGWTSLLSKGLSRVLSMEKETATHSSILGWENPWIEEPGGLQSMGLQEKKKRVLSNTTIQKH